MASNISIGQYYPVNSLIHKLDPRVKLLCAITLIVVVFNIHTFIAYFGAIAFTIGTIKLSKVPLKKILKGLKPIVLLLVFTGVLNIFFTPGETILYEIGSIQITLEGILIAIQTIMKLTLIICFSSLLTYTTSPIELTDAIEYYLNPLKVIKVPAHEIALMMTIALRFIPTLVDEMDKIMKAQMSRGSEFDTGNIVQKAKSLVPVLVPLFISSFRSADELAMAMEARCYRGDINRTRMKVMKITKLDVYALIIFVIFLVLLFFLMNL